MSVDQDARWYANSVMEARYTTRIGPFEKVEDGGYIHRMNAISIDNVSLEQFEEELQKAYTAGYEAAAHKFA